MRAKGAGAERLVMIVCVLFFWSGKDNRQASFNCLLMMQCIWANGWAVFVGIGWFGVSQISERTLITRKEALNDYMQSHSWRDDQLSPAA
jgi:hypothetical protein